VTSISIPGNARSFVATHEHHNACPSPHSVDAFDGDAYIALSAVTEALIRTISTLPMKELMRIFRRVFKLPIWSN